MDDRRFDDLIKRAGTARSRRTIIGALVAGTLGGGAAARGAAAQKLGAEALTCRQFCREDRDCNFGLRCGRASEECFAIPSSRNRCNGNSDCPRRNEVCGENNRCTNETECIECRRDGDCAGSDSRCRDRRCVERR
jgi:hypothetical protein